MDGGRSVRVGRGAWTIGGRGGRGPRTRRKGCSACKSGQGYGLSLWLNSWRTWV